MIRLFIATNLEPGELSRETRDEFIEVVRVSFSEALDMVWDGRIVDAKSMAAILFRGSICARRSQWERTDWACGCAPACVPR